jgi:4-hydroxy-tetrahydrodipicolinate reductase
MGQTVCAAVEDAGDMELVARPDVVVDFTVPATVFENARLCLERDTHAVVGTTGLEPAQLEALRELAGRSRGNCLIVPNFAIGAVLMMEAAKMIAPHMPDCEIIELHHEQKLDAPSGTAKRTAELIAQAGGRAEPPIHSVRLPGLVAHQEVLFGGLGQTLSVRHDSISRESFMPGVLIAVRRVSEVDGLVAGLENVL